MTEIKPADLKINISVTERILCASPDRPHGGALLSVSQAGRRLVRVLRFLCTELVHILFGPKKTNPAAFVVSSGSQVHITQVCGTLASDWSVIALCRTPWMPF